MPPIHKKKTMESLWRGPESDDAQGGVTFSLMSKFLQCRERFRIYVIEGLRATQTFNQAIEYGSMWHTCEESLAKNSIPVHDWDVVFAPLRKYVDELRRQYPFFGEEIEHWRTVCETQFPEYSAYWTRNGGFNRDVLCAEETFKVPYRLPSGRTVYLRGKWDSVEFDDGVWLFETKTKSEIDGVQITKNLVNDMQTQLYIVALRTAIGLHRQGGDVGLPASMTHFSPEEVRGVRYNVIRRPLAGGMGSIRQHKPTKSNPLGESREEFYGRLRGIIVDNPDEYFARWRVEVSADDIRRFQTRTLNPLLEQLCDWYDCVTNCIDPWGCSHNRHWVHPFGCRPLGEDGSGDVDEYVFNGSLVGMRKTDTLFRELT